MMTIECEQADCQNRVPASSAGSNWLALITEAPDAFRAQERGKRIAEGALWFCSWRCLQEYVSAQMAKA